MERTAIVEKLTSIFREIFSDGTLVLRDDMTAAEVDNWDSLTHMLMISRVEKEFGVKFKLKEVNRLNTVGDIIDLLIQKSSE